MINMPHPKKLKRTMEYFLIYHPETNSYFCNKSKNPKVSDYVDDFREYVDRYI